FGSRVAGVIDGEEVDVAELVSDCQSDPVLDRKPEEPVCIENHHVLDVMVPGRPLLLGVAFLALQPNQERDSMCAEEPHDGVTVSNRNLHPHRTKKADEQRSLVLETIAQEVPREYPVIKEAQVIVIHSGVSFIFGCNC